MNQTETRTLTWNAAADTTPPIINSVNLNTSTPKIYDDILVTVNATDNVGIASVAANGVSLINKSRNIWIGTIIAEAGNNTVKVSARDTAGHIAWNNSTGYNATSSEFKLYANIDCLES